MNVEYLLYSSTYTQDFRFVYVLEGLIREERERIKQIFRNHYYKQEKSDHYDVVKLGERLVISRYFYTGEKDYTGRGLYGIEGYSVAMSDVKKELEMVGNFIRVIASYSILRKKGSVELDKTIESKLSFDFMADDLNRPAIEKEAYDALYEKIRSLVHDTRDNENGMGSADDVADVVAVTNQVIVQIGCDQSGIITLNSKDLGHSIMACDATQVSKSITNDIVNRVMDFDYGKHQSIEVRMTMTISDEGIAFEKEWHLEGPKALGRVIRSIDENQDRIRQVLAYEVQKRKVASGSVPLAEVEMMKKEIARLKNENEMFKRSSMAFGRR